MSLARKLGFWDIFCLAAGAMISSGLFVLPGQAFGYSGPAVVLAYAIAALLVIPAMLSKAELATAMPKSGGSYFFIERSMGAMAGTLAGLANWLSLALKSAFAMVGIGAFAQLIWPAADLASPSGEWIVKGVAVGFCLAFTVLNLLSVKAAGRAQVVMVVGLLAVLGVFIVWGVPHIRQHPNFDNFLGQGFGNVFATAGLVFVSFGGLTKVAGVAEEVHQPGRNLPRAMFASFVVVSLLYIAAVLVVVGTVPAETLGRAPYGDLTPLSTSAGAFLGRGGAILLAAAAILAFVTTGNGGILSASRNPMAMSRDGLLPAALARISRFGTPHVSVLLTSAFMLVMICVLNIADLVKVASTMMLLLYLLENLAVVIMRGSRIQNYRPLYRSPFFPWLQLAGIVLYGMLMAELIARLGFVPLITASSFLAAGTLWYIFYSRPRSRRESALLHIVKRIASFDRQRSTLEEELRQIAVERDEIVHDRFDHLIQDCPILDLQGPTSAEKMFAQSAEVLSERLGIDPADLREKFRLREEESSTVIQPGLAIPHILIEGHHRFDILLVRCLGGIVFQPDHPYVKTCFILIGSPDERNYHLRALMTIAGIVQEKGFLDRWLAAESPEQLRDLILLSGRRREKGSAV
ncbi:MAG: amino acid permease [Phycisphaerae bacterium]|nr:amino acid permease [Phycisphaerae bacterium]